MRIRLILPVIGVSIHSRIGKTGCIDTVYCQWQGNNKCHRHQQPCLREELIADSFPGSSHTSHQPDVLPPCIATYPERAHHTEKHAQQGKSRQ